VAFAFGGCAAVWVPRRHEFVARRLPTSHAELSNVCPKNIHRVVHSLCALIVGRAIDMSAFIRAKLAGAAATVLLILSAPAALSGW
jgi:hypothetical protein